MRRTCTAPISVVLQTARVSSGEEVLILIGGCLRWEVSVGQASEVLRPISMGVVISGVGDSAVAEVLATGAVGLVMVVDMAGIVE